MKQDKKRIMLITPMLHQGGFERICVLTAKLLKDLYDVYLVVFTTEDAFYDVSGLNVIDLQLGSVEGKLGKISNIHKRVKRLKCLKRQLGINVSYSFGTTANIVNVLSKVKDTTWAGIRGYNALSDRGAGLIFRRADCVVSCTKTMESNINSAFRTKKSAALYNPCDLEEIWKLSEERCAGEPETFTRQHSPIIVSMGREDDLKGFWHLMKCFALVKREIPQAGLMIIGDGNYLEYKKLAEDLGVMESVCFTGVQKNPFALLAKADVYALTSESEGFPNALIEAMAVGLPCVSVNCLTGPAEILHEDYSSLGDRNQTVHADYGILTGVFKGAKDMDASHVTEEERCFAAEVTALLKDKALYQHYQQAGRQRAQAFGIETYLNHLKSMIDGS